MRNVDYSETLSFAGGEKRQFKLSFLKPRGPRGGRNVISKLRIRAAIQVDTNGSTTIAAGGWAQALANLRMVGPQGEFCNLSGPEIRMLHFAENGRNAVPDPAALAISQTNATRTIELVLDLTPKIRAKRRWDFGVPVDHFLAVGDQAIELKAATAADLGTGGGTTLDSLTFQLIAECREEADIQDHVFRELRSLAQNQLTDFELPVSGSLIRGCYAYKAADHITGGADVSSITGVSISALGVDSVDPTHLQAAFIDEGTHDRASTNDPFVQTTRRVLPLVFPSNAEKLTDMPRHTSKMGIRLTGNSVSNMSLVFDLISEKTEKGLSVELMHAAQLGLTHRSVKTEGKTRRDQSDWPGLTRFLPGKWSRGA